MEKKTTQEIRISSKIMLELAKFQKEQDNINNKKWVSVDDLINWIDNKIEKVDQRSQTDEQKRVVISCLNCLRDILLE